MDNRDSGATLIEEVSVIARPQCGTCRHGDGSDLHHAEVCSDKLRPVREDQKRALFLLESKFKQAIPNTINFRSNFGICHPRFAANECSLVFAAFPDVAVDKMVHEIVPI